MSHYFKNLATRKLATQKQYCGPRVHEGVYENSLLPLLENKGTAASGA